MEIFRNNLEPSLQFYLKNLYSTLAYTALASIFGGCVQVLTETSQFSNPLWDPIVFLVLAKSCENNNYEVAFWFLLLFAFLSGLRLGPLLDFALKQEPYAIPKALVITSLLVICFTLATINSNSHLPIFAGWIHTSYMLHVSLVLLLEYNISLSSYIGVFGQNFIAIALMSTDLFFETQICMEAYRNIDRNYALNTCFIGCKVAFFFVKNLSILSLTTNFRIDTIYVAVIALMFFFKHTQGCMEAYYIGDRNYIWYSWYLFIETSTIYKSLLAALATSYKL